MFLTALDTKTNDLRGDDELWKLLFADDLFITIDTKEEPQQRYLAWKDSLEREGMKVNTKKTQVTVSSKGHQEINIISDGRRLKQLEKIKYQYLGSLITEEGGTEKAVNGANGERSMV